jgi:hypothetical protein
MSSTNDSGKPQALPTQRTTRQQPKSRGQRVSNERGSHTRSKKNPGKRTHQGGS